MGKRKKVVRIDSPKKPKTKRGSTKLPVAKWLEIFAFSRSAEISSNNDSGTAERVKGLSNLRLANAVKTFSQAKATKRPDYYCAVVAEIFRRNLITLERVQIDLEALGCRLKMLRRNRPKH